MSEEKKPDGLGTNGSIFSPGHNSIMSHFGSEETTSEKFVRKARESPFMIVGKSLLFVFLQLRNIVR